MQFNSFACFRCINTDIGWCFRCLSFFFWICFFVFFLLYFMIFFSHDSCCPVKVSKSTRGGDNFRPNVVASKRKCNHSDGLFFNLKQKLKFIYKKERKVSSLSITHKSYQPPTPPLSFSLVHCSFRSDGRRERRVKENEFIKDFFEVRKIFCCTTEKRVGEDGRSLACGNHHVAY